MDRRRLAALADFRQLTDVEAAQILDPATSKTCNEPIEWQETLPGDRRVEVRFRARVFNSMDESLWIVGRINRDHPERSHWMLLWGDKAQQEHTVNLRRLDLRDRHKNPDGKAWDRQTHKHRWSFSSGNDWAYTPSGIPHDPFPRPVRPDDYRAIFEAFTQECGITLGPDYNWADPDLSTGAAAPLWEVP